MEVEFHKIFKQRLIKGVISKMNVHLCFKILEMRTRQFILLFLGVFFSLSGFSQKTKPLDKINAVISVLSSDSLEGRKPGLIGDTKAANYIRDEFKKANILLLGDEGFSHFKVVTSVSTGTKNKFNFLNQEFILGKDYLPLTVSKNEGLFANVYFAGYGFDINTDSLKWSDYPTTFQVNRMWVVVIRGVPDPENPKSKYAPYASDWVKIATAKDKGAKGIILVSPKSLEPKDSLMPLYVDQQAGTASIPVINATRNCVNKMLWNYGVDIEVIVKQLSSELKQVGVYVPAKLAAETDLNIVRSNTQNIVGVIEGSDPVLKNEYIVIGAHYDHLGYGGIGSNSRMPDTTAIHYGADDNASGVAMMLDIANRINSNKLKFKRSIIFVAFGAEELGIVGSKFFFKDKLVDTKMIKAMINLDMVGRMNAEKRLQIGGTGTAIEFNELIDRINKKYLFSVQKNPDGYGPSDHSSFYSSKIPVLFFSTGAHEDYHTPFDTPDKINYTAMKKILGFVYDVIFDLSNRTKPLQYQELEAPVSQGSHGKLKVTLGIIPDVSTSDNKGLRIDGVRKGGIADQAGLVKGDVIVAINGSSVTNIYDYMARMSSLILGQTATIDYLRDGIKKVTIVQL